MCFACAATQVPVCAAAGSCAGALSQLGALAVVTGGIVLGTAKLWFRAFFLQLKTVVVTHTNTYAKK